MVKSLHHLYMTETFTRMATNIRQPILARARQSTHTPPKKDHGQHNKRHTAQNDQRQLCVGQKQQHHATKEHQYIPQRYGYRRANNGLQQRGIGGDSGLNFAGGIVFKVTRVHMHQMIKYSQPNICAHPLAHPRDKIEAHKGTYGQNPIKVTNNISDWVNISISPLAKPLSMTMRMPCPATRWHWRSQLSHAGNNHLPFVGF